MEKKKTKADVKIDVSDKSPRMRRVIEFFADGVQVTPEYNSDFDAALRAVDEIRSAFRGAYLHSDEFVMRIKNERE